MSRVDRFLIAALVLWFAPTIALRWGTLAAVKARFAVEMAVVEVLFAIRRDRAARQMLAGVIRRNRRAVQAEKRQARRTTR